MNIKIILKSILLVPIFLFVVSCDILKQNPADTNSTPPDLVVLSGTLTEEGGGVLPNATVTVGTATQTTNSSGAFYFGTDLVDGSYSLTAAKTGYYTITRSVTISKDSPKNLSLSIFKKSSGVVINATTGGSVAPLNIPANALNATTEISVTNIFGAGIPNQSTSTLIVAAYALEPNGLAFKTPASLQISNPLSRISPTIFKARSGSEQLNIYSLDGNLLIPVGHFSEVIIEIPSTNFRYRIVDDIKTILTSKLASCSDLEVFYKDTTVTPRINSISIIDTKTIETAIGSLTSPTTISLKITRKLGDPIRQLTYKVNNKKYIFELNEGTGWNVIAEIVKPEITMVAKDIEKCHDQGNVSSSN